MICVPDATTLPRVRRPMRRSNSRMASSGNPSGNVGNGLLEHEAHQFPVPGHRVLARRDLGHAAERAERRAAGAAGPRAARSREMPSALQVRDAERHLGRDVAEGVAAFVAVGRRVRQFADADAVEHDDECAPER